MQQIRKVIKKAFMPVTLMMIPHSNKSAHNVRIPLICILVAIFLWFFGTSYTFYTAVRSVQYYAMKESLSFYADQFQNLKTTIVALKKSEEQFRRLFSLGSREEVLKNVDTLDSGSIDLAVLKEQIKASTEAVTEIKNYIKLARDMDLATPKGLPAEAQITSPFGRRASPMNQDPEFHTGIDLSAPQGTPIRATADGIVSFAGWSGGSGLLVVVEHGFDMSTFYAHAKEIIVKVGAEVKRSQVIGYVGSTGTSTGPHVHYEIWVKGKPVNPAAYI